MEGGPSPGEGSPPPESRQSRYRESIKVGTVALKLALSLFAPPDGEGHRQVNLPELGGGPSVTQAEADTAEKNFGLFFSDGQETGAGESPNGPEHMRRKEPGVRRIQRGRSRGQPPPRV